MQSELALSQKGQRGRAGIVYDVLQLTESRHFPYHNLAENPSLTAVSTFRLTVPHHRHRISDADRKYFPKAEDVGYINHEGVLLFSESFI